MWARHFEISLGLWLCLSPFVFTHGADERALWITDLTCGAALIVLACLSYARSLRRAHLSELIVVGWLVVHGWLLATETGSPAGQNQLVVGMLVAMFAIVPSRATVPPDAWRRET